MEKNWVFWLSSMYQNYSIGAFIENVMDFLIILSDVKKTYTVLDCGTGLGTLAFKLADKIDDGKVYALDVDDECVKYCNDLVAKKGLIYKIEVLKRSIDETKLQNASVDRVFSRSAIMYLKNKQKVFDEFYRILKDRGMVLAYEPIVEEKYFRIHKLLNPKKTPNFEFYKEIEEKIRNNEDDFIYNYDEKTIKNNLIKSGFKCVKVIKTYTYDYFDLTQERINRRIFYSNTPTIPDFKEKCLKYMNEHEFNTYYNEVIKQLIGKRTYAKTTGLFVIGIKNPKISDYLKLYLNIFILFFSYVIWRNLLSLLERIFKLEEIIF